MQEVWLWKLPNISEVEHWWPRENYHLSKWRKGSNLCTILVKSFWAVWGCGFIKEWGGDNCDDDLWPANRGHDQLSQVFLELVKSQWAASTSRSTNGLMGNLHQVDGTALVLGDQTKLNWHLSNSMTESFPCPSGICYLLGEQPKKTCEVDEHPVVITKEETKQMVRFWWFFILTQNISGRSKKDCYQRKDKTMQKTSLMGRTMGLMQLFQ